MQVFIPYAEPILVAECLDKKRLNKQVLECKQILSAIEGTSKPWVNHPVVKMYWAHKKWLTAYMNTLDFYRHGFLETAKLCSDESRVFRPIWMTDKFCKTHRRRLYAKDPDKYSQFKSDGFSVFNYYVVNNQVLVYKDGKLIHNESLISYL